MARLLGNTSKDLIRRYHAIWHRLIQHHHPYDQEHFVLVAQMNEAEVAMLEGELKEIKIKLNLMGIDEPVIAPSAYQTIPVNVVSTRYKPND